MKDAPKYAIFQDGNKKYRVFKKVATTNESSSGKCWFVDGWARTRHEGHIYEQCWKNDIADLATARAVVKELERADKEKELAKQVSFIE